MSRQNTSVSLKTRQGLFLIMPTMLRKGNIILRVHNVPPIVHWLILKALVWYCGRKSLEAFKALAEGIWEIKSFISTAQSASCFSVVGSLLLKVFLFFPLRVLNT